MKVFYLLLLGIVIAGCNSDKKEMPNNNVENSEIVIEKTIDTTGAKQFWDRLTKLCGKSFEGQLASEPYTDDFTGKKLVMHVLSCSENEILIPFNVGDDRSRTWILTYDNARITLKHDHRHEDGSSDETTMYGGTSNNDGSPEMITFPADQQTVEIIPEAFANIWWITVNDSIYSYNLRRVSGNRVFNVAFDLTKEIETPLPSWGWEDFRK